MREKGRSNVVVESFGDHPAREIGCGSSWVSKIPPSALRLFGEMSERRWVCCEKFGGGEVVGKTRVVVVGDAVWLLVLGGCLKDKIGSIIGIWTGLSSRRSAGRIGCAKGWAVLSLSAVGERQINGSA